MTFDGNSLIAGFAVSTVGFGFFMYGKKQARAPHIIFGLICMVYPYVIGSPLLMLGMFALLSALLFLALRLGY